MGAREIAQWLKASAAFKEDLGLVSGTHMVAHNCLTPGPGDPLPSPGMLGHPHTVNVYTLWHTHIK